MKLDNIYLSYEQTEKLENKLEEYNKKHEGEEISYQKLAEKLLDYAIRYVSIDSID